MTVGHAALDTRTLDALAGTTPRIACLVGGCGTGRTAALLRLREQIGPAACQYFDVERCATTPERFAQALRSSSPFTLPGPDADLSSARAAYDAALRFFEQARTPAGPATFLLDEAFELRTFESFPGLRYALRDLVAMLERSPNRFVLTSRYVTRARRLLRDASERIEIVHVGPLTVREVRDLLPFSTQHRLPEEVDELARTIHALADGRPLYVKAIGESMAAMEGEGGSDPVSALVALLGSDGLLSQVCRLSYELRLHRARGYGALKAILDILAQRESLNLTEIAQRLHRTPGSTKDYLSWLEDVDLITVRQKRYTFTDPILRLWVRLHCRPAPPSVEELAGEVHAYAMSRLPQTEPALTMSGPSPLGDEAAARRAWGIIEID